MEYYFKISDDGIATVLCIAPDGSYSLHTSEDATQADGDGAVGPYDWADGYAWDKTTKEHAETLLQFEFVEVL